MPYILKLTISLSQCYEAYSRFRSGDILIQDLSKSGRSNVVDNDAVNDSTESDPKQTIKDVTIAIWYGRLLFESNVPHQEAMWRRMCSGSDDGDAKWPPVLQSDPGEFEYRGLYSSSIRKFSATYKIKLRSQLVVTRRQSCGS